VTEPLSDPILGKVVLDFSRKYVSIYLCEGDGTIKDFEHVQWPYRLDAKDTRQECRDAFDFMYQWAIDNLLQEDGEEEPD
jgi:hypothetical protein